MIEPDNTSYQDVILRYLSGEATKEEERQVQQLILTDATWREYFQKASRIYDAAQPVGDDNRFDAEKARKKFIEFTEKEKAGKMITMPQKFGFYISIASAAAVVLIIVLIWFNKPVNEEENTILCTIDNQKIQFQDGSFVVLQKGTEIVCPDNFSQHRQITLSGEAMFSVVHDSLLPFRVKTKNIQVIVLGTEFTVRAWPNDSNSSVSVSKGKVLFVIPGTEDTIQLNNGEAGLYNQINQTIGFYKRTDTSYFFLKGRDIQFENVPMSDVIRVLSVAYKTRIDVENKAILNCPVTARFTNRSLDNIIEMVQAILNVHCEKVGQSYIIKGNGC